MYCLELYKNQYEKDMKLLQDNSENNYSLFGKWMPRESQKSLVGYLKICKVNEIKSSVLQEL